MNGQLKLNIKMIQHLFPKLKNKDDFFKLKIDDESIHYISTKDVALKITDIIYYHLIKLNIDPKEAVITDTTAGVGGDTISFANKFYFVNAIEIDPLRVEYLMNNLNIYELTNVQIIKGDCLAHLPFLQHNVVFFDPPWGGKNYKYHKKLKLAISDYLIEEIINDLLHDPVIECSPDIVVLKIPKNFDLYCFFQAVKSSTIYFYQLKKMDILVIENNKK
jgi:16S rRNA G966 N2-methylase RsmD